MGVVQRGSRFAPCAESGFSMVELLIVLAIISIIAMIGMGISYHAFDVARLGRTVANMRGIADALTKYQTDTSSLPGGGIQPVSAIASMIQPSGGSIALLDGWGNPVYYTPWSTGGTISFRLFSYGKDGAADGVVTGTWVDFYTDIVVEGGSFIQTKW